MAERFKGSWAETQSALSEEYSWHNRVRSKIVAWTSILASHFERSTMLCVVLILLLFVPVATVEALHRPLTNDEIYTAHIAQQPDIHAMLLLSREVDLHPPLHYLAERIGLKAFFPRTLSARLPSIIGGIVACLALFHFASARFGNLLGLSTICIFWLTPALDWSWSNRPYMLWLMFLNLLLLAWHEAGKDNASRWYALFAGIVATAMVSTHLLGIVTVFPFVIAELWRARKGARPNYLLVLMLVLPIFIGLGFHYQINALEHNSFPPSQLASFSLVWGTYSCLMVNTLIVVTGCATVATLLFGSSESGPSNSFIDRVSKTDMVLLLSLFFLPLVIIFLAAIRHVQYWIRYSTPAMPAVALLTIWILSKRLRFLHQIALLLICSTMGYMANEVITASFNEHADSGVLAGRDRISLASLASSLPIVSASPMTYVEMADREPLSVSQRTYYLIDRDAALQYSGYTLFENENKIRDLLNLPSQTDDLRHFTSIHPKFYMIGDYSRPEVWLPYKLRADGFHMDYIGKCEPGYESDDLYLVSRKE